jgi:O-antigen/teichoic acid export membrane protein
VTSIGIVQFGWRLAAGVLTVVTAIVVSSRLGLATQGLVATNVAVIATLSVLTGGGFSHAVAFVVARDRATARNAVEVAALTSAVVGVIVGVVIAVVGSSALSSLPVLWWHVALTLPFFQVGQMGLGLQQGSGSWRGYLTTYVSQPITAFAVATMAALNDGWSPVPSRWSGALVVAPFLIQALTVIRPWRALPPSDETRTLSQLLSYTARIYPSTLAHYLSYRLDLLLVGALLGTTAAGIYSLALNGVDAVARVGQTIATLLFPSFAVAAAEKDTVSLARRAALIGGILSFVAITSLAVTILILSEWAGQEVRTVGILLALLTGAGGAISAWGILASYLAARNRLGALARVNAVVLVTSAGLYLLLIPIVGVYGGAIGTTLGLLVAVFIALIELPDKRPAAAAPPPRGSSSSG